MPLNYSTGDNPLGWINLFNTTMMPQVSNSVVQGIEPPSHDIPLYMLLTVTILYVLIFVFGTVGNILVAFVIWRNREMRNSTNVFLMNLSLADLLVLLVTMPTALMELHTREKWYLGEAMCKAVPFIENAVADASVLTILAISLERYYAICHPFRAQYMCTPTRSVKILAVVWIIAAAVAIPFIFYAALRYEEFYDGTKAYACSTAFTDQKGRVYILCSTALFFVMPLILLSLLYSIIIKRLVYDAKALLDGDVNSASAQKTRRQVVYMLISIKVLFFVCMLPFRVFSIFMIYTPMDKLADLGLEGYLNILCFSRIMFYMNSAGNPIMYNVLSTKFRNAFKRALGCSKDRRLERRLTLSTYYSAARQTPNHESTGDTESTMCL